jgi:tripartite-type tricarboxylate transporter receptor subunit TctC
MTAAISIRAITGARRLVLPCLGMAWLGLFAGAGPSFAQASATAFPSAPIKIVLGFPAGAFMDVIVRVIAPGVSDILGQPIVVENRPGASTNIAAEAVVRSPNNGYTLLLGSSSNLTNMKLFKKLPFDFIKDLEPVSLTASAPLILAVHPSIPVTSVRDFIAFVKSRPGQISFASNGRGTATLIAGQMFNQKAGAEMVPIYYRGSNEAIADLLTGRVQVMFSPASSVMSHIRAGTLKALAVTSHTRTSLAPELPTMAEAGLQGYRLSIWIGMMAPAGTPREIVEKLSGAFQRVLGTAEVREKLVAQGAEVAFKSPGEFAAFISEDTENWSAISEALNFQPE